MNCCLSCVMDLNDTNRSRQDMKWKVTFDSNWMATMIRLDFHLIFKGYNVSIYLGDLLGWIYVLNRGDSEKVSNLMMR